MSNDPADSRHSASSLSRRAHHCLTFVIRRHMIKLQPLGGQTAIGEGDKSKINAQAARGQMRRQLSVFSKSQTAYLKTEN